MPTLTPDQIVTSTHAPITTQADYDAANPVGPAADFKQAGKNALDIGKGAVKGGLRTFNGLVDMMGHGYQTPSKVFNINTDDTNDYQKTGDVIGNLLQWAIPGAAGEKMATTGEEMLPKVPGWLARLSGRAAAEVPMSAALNKAQGGGATTGAVMGAGGAGFGELANYLAPHLAEAAMGVRAPDRAYGRMPGRAILDETTGIRPGTIAAQASDKTGLLTDQVEKSLDAAPEGSLHGPRSVADSFLDTAVARNSPESIKRTGALRNLITTKLGADGKPVMMDVMGDVNQPTGILDEFGKPVMRIGRDVVGREPAAYPEDVPARTLLDLKRGVGEQSQAFNPNVKNKLGDSATGALYHSLDSQMDELAPETKGANERITSLLPVVQRGEAADLNAGPIQRLIGRGRAHTGALTAGMGGFATGHPLLGMGTLALIEAGMSPEPLMGAARLFNSPIGRQVALTAGKSLTAHTINQPQ